jgi:hypothetical protein
MTIALRECKAKASASAARTWEKEDIANAVL